MWFPAKLLEELKQNEPDEAPAPVPVRIQNSDPVPEAERKATLTNQPKRRFPGHDESATGPHGRNQV